MDFMNNSYDIFMANQQKLQQIQQEVAKRNMEFAKLPKPGEKCPQFCRQNEECEACLKQQQEFWEGLKAFERLEMQPPKAEATNMAKKPEKCSLCSAPFEYGKKECPYCGTVYPAYDMDSEELPQDGVARQEALLKRAQALYTIFCQVNERFVRLSYEVFMVDLVAQYPSDYKDAVFQDRMALQKGPYMDERMLFAGAQKYNLKLSEYIYQIASGRILPLPIEQRNEQLQREDAIRHQNHEIQMNAMRQNHERSMEQMRRQGEMLVNKTPQYNGGGSGGLEKCCGNCVSYMAANAQCARDGLGRSATEFCGWYSMKQNTKEVYLWD